MREEQVDIEFIQEADIALIQEGANENTNYILAIY